MNTYSNTETIFSAKCMNNFGNVCFFIDHADLQKKQRALKDGEYLVVRELPVSYLLNRDITENDLAINISQVEKTLLKRNIVHPKSIIAKIIGQKVNKDNLTIDFVVMKKNHGKIEILTIELNGIFHYYNDNENSLAHQIRCDMMKETALTLSGIRFLELRATNEEELDNSCLIAEKTIKEIL